MRRRFYIGYTVFFLFLMAGMFLPFFLTGRSMVWNIDGRSQYFPQIVYLRRYLREFFSGLLQGDAAVRFYDFAIGMGEGILVAARLHRLDFLSVLFSVDKLGVFYTFLILLRLYFSGMAFSAYCRYRQLENRAILIGNVVYLSSGFAMRRVPMHPFFGIAMIMLPLMLLGVEKVIEEGKCRLLITVVAASFLATYYYAYMCTIVVGIYFLLRWPQTRCSRFTSGKISLFFIKILHIIGSWIVGVGMVSVILVPLFGHLFSSDRVKIERTEVSLFRYPLKYIGNLLLSFITPNIEAGYNTRLNFIALVIPVLIVLFFQRISKLTSLRLAILAEAIGLLVPGVGLVMGAFGNVSNRWTFLIAFTLAYAAVHVVQTGPAYGKIPNRVLGIVTLLYLAGTLVFTVMGSCWGISVSYRLNVACGCVSLIVTTGIMFLMDWKKVSYASHCYILLAVSVFSAIMMGVITYLPGLNGTVKEYMKWDALPSFYDNQPEAILNEAHDGSFFRVETGFDHSTSLNSSLYHEYYGISEFNSVMNAELQHFLLELESPGIVNTVKVMSMDARAICENLASVRYYLTRSNDKILPYGFEKLKDSADGAYTLYENRTPLHFAYTNNCFISESEYEKLNTAGKQQTLNKAVILDDAVSGDIPLKQVSGTEILQTKEQNLYVNVEKENVSSEGQVASTSFGYDLKQDGELSFHCKQRAGCECYLRITGISYEDANEPDDDECLVISCGSGAKTLYLRSPENAYYVPMENRMIYMGYYSKETQDEMHIRLNGKGRCRICGIELVYIPMDSFDEDVNKRNEGGCCNPTITGNQVEGDLEDAGSRFVVLSVLYSKGWKAKVDGKPVPLVRANGCYSGFYVSEGAHHFVLTYKPPYFSVALFLTAFFLLLFIAGCKKKMF